ncbi:MAG: TonB-dependent receptor [Bacteroidia bacterium]
MKKIAITIGGLSFTTLSVIGQQQTDTTQIQLDEIQIVTYKAMNGIGRINRDYNGVVFIGKKNEVLEIDTLEANKSVNNTRQIIGRVPGVNIIETESGGFTSNGIGFRGINPYQSIETNTRQNGYNISADIYGYNESYYLPPMEAVKKIVFLRGASALAFGPQIGGMIDYELHRDASQPLEITGNQTIGSNGLFSSFISLNGKIKNFNYYSFLKKRDFEGWRKNSKQQQISAFGGIGYTFNSHLKIGAEYTLFRNTIQMPGGLNDSLFNAAPQQSLRARNWLQTPWNVLSAYLNYDISKNTYFRFISSYAFSQRNLVWRNEDIPPQEKDTIGTNYSYEPREVVKRTFNNLNNELKFIHKYNVLNAQQILNAGLKYNYSYSTKKHDAEGTTGSDPDFTNVTEWGGFMKYYTTNIAAYVENVFNIKDQLLISPGLRAEYLSNTINGYDKNKAGDSNEDKVFANNDQRIRKFILAALSLQYNISSNINIIANYNQSYRPVTYSDLTPFGTIAKIDPNLKDPSADNVDIAIRGSIKNIINFDIGAFYLHYKNKIGTVIRQQDTLNYYFRTNTGASEHKGIESYVEINILNGLIPSSLLGKLSVYNSFAYIDAKYVAGKYAGNIVEYAPQNIERFGINYYFKNFSMNFQYSYTSQSYADAANTKFDINGIEGIIPAYKVMDVSLSYKFNSHLKINFGVNNITDEKYFTLRTDEYPGPGIIPSIGRMIYGGIHYQF